MTFHLKQCQAFFHSLMEYFSSSYLELVHVIIVLTGTESFKAIVTLRYSIQITFIRITYIFGFVLNADFNSILDHFWLWIHKICFFLKKKVLFIYWRERELKQDRGRGRGMDRISSRLKAEYRVGCGAGPHESEIMT